MENTIFWQTLPKIFHKAVKCWEIYFNSATFLYLWKQRTSLFIIPYNSAVRTQDRCCKKVQHSVLHLQIRNCLSRIIPGCSLTQAIFIMCQLQHHHHHQEASPLLSVGSYSTGIWLNRPQGNWMDNRRLHDLAMQLIYLAMASGQQKTAVETYLCLSRNKTEWWITDWWSTAWKQNHWWPEQNVMWRFQQALSCLSRSRMKLCPVCVKCPPGVTKTSSHRPTFIIHPHQYILMQMNSVSLSNHGSPTSPLSS